MVAVQKELDVVGKNSAWDDYKKAVDGKSNAQARLVAREILGKDIFWDWDCMCNACYLSISYVDAKKFIFQYPVRKRDSIIPPVETR